jgi:hypothetical protein
MTAVRAGVVSGALAVVAGAFFGVSPPDAYGLCMACHGRDLVNSVVNAVAHTRLVVAPASSVYPVLTTVGVLIGAFAAARANGELRWWTPDHPAKTFAYGFAVMVCALVAGGCSLRLVLRAGAGEPLGVLGVGGLLTGIALGTYWLRWRATG